MAGAFLKAFRREAAWLRRSPWDLGLIVVGPLVTLVVLGWMFVGSVAQRLPVAFVDQDRSAFSRQVGRNLDAASQIRVASAPADLQAAWNGLRAGRVWAVVYVPDHAEREILAGRQATVFVYQNAAFYSLGALASMGADAAVQGAAAHMTPEIARTRNIPFARVTAPKVQSTILFNPQLSYEWFLEALLQPGVLHLMMSCAVVAAVGREFRGRVLAWPGRAAEAVPALAGKLAPYVLVFTAWNLIGVGWLCGVRGWGVHGSVAVLALAQLLLYAAYAAIAAAVTLLVRDVATALSAAAVYGGPAITFSNATLPTIDAPLFTQVWSRALPYTAYVEVQMEQMFMGSPASASFAALGTLAAFAVGAFALASLLVVRRAGERGAAPAMGARAAEAGR